MDVIAYQDEVFKVSVTADRLAAVARLLDAYYFEQAFDARDPVSKDWWAISHDDIQSVVGLVAATAASVKNRLDELARVNVEGRA